MIRLHKNRSSEKIISDVIGAIWSGKNIRTHIMYRANLSYDQLEQYIEFMKQKGLIEQYNGQNPIYDKSAIKYRVTEKGDYFFTNYNKLMELIA